MMKKLMFLGIRFLAIGALHLWLKKAQTATSEGTKRFPFNKFGFIISSILLAALAAR